MGAVHGAGILGLCLPRSCHKFRKDPVHLGLMGGNKAAEKIHYSCIAINDN